MFNNNLISYGCYGKISWLLTCNLSFGRSLIFFEAASERFWTHSNNFWSNISILVPLRFHWRTKYFVKEQVHENKNYVSKIFRPIVPLNILIWQFYDCILELVICAVDTIQDFLCKLGMKPHLHLLEISIFSLNHVIVRPTEIIKDLRKAST